MIQASDFASGAGFVFVAAVSFSGRRLSDSAWSRQCNRLQLWPLLHILHSKWQSSAVRPGKEVGR